MYTSTRKRMSVHASSAILKGLSSEGGLFVKSELDASFYKSIKSHQYKAIAYDVFSYFLDDYTSDMITAIVELSYGKAFHGDVSHVVTHGDESMMHLSQGPTFAFKDVALQALPHMYHYAKTIQNDHKKTMILTATSGDTGGAALDGFSKLDDTLVIVLYPTQGVSPFQKKQMKTYQSESCFVFGVDGDFDDCQRIVKSLFKDVTPKHTHLSSANSINIGRIIAQVTYYIYSYKYLVKTKVIKEGDPLDVIVPSGNFGNIYAAYLAKKLGTPLETLVIASNKNNALTTIFNAHTYLSDQALFQTITPSMDILIASNLERYMYHLTDDPIQIKSLYEALKKKKKTHFPMLKNQEDFKAYFVTEKDTMKSIKTYYETHGKLIDPHTAVAYGTYQANHKNKTNNHTLIVSTASPYKFPHTVLDALHKKSDLSLGEAIESLRQLDNNPFDMRLFDILHHRSKDHTLSLDAAIPYIKKVIEFYDIPN